MLCKPHSFKIKVQWTAHNINNKNKQQHKHRQEVSSKETEPVCAAPLYHAIVKPGGLELNIYSYPETFSGAEMTRTNSFSLLDMEGKTEKMDTIKGIKKKKKKRWWVTSILRPSTSVPCSFSLALSASALDSNVTKPKPWKHKHKWKKRRRRWVRKAWTLLLSFFIKLIYRQILKVTRCSCVLPWIPSHWKWSRRQEFCQIAEIKKKKKLNKHVRPVLHLATGGQHCSVMMNWQWATFGSPFSSSTFLCSILCNTFLLKQPSRFSLLTLNNSSTSWYYKS